MIPGFNYADAQDSIADAIYRLGFMDADELEGAGAAPYVTVDELYQFIDDAAKALAVKAGVFIQFSTAVNLEAGKAVYNLDAQQILTLLAGVLTSPDSETVDMIWGMAGWNTAGWSGSGQIPAGTATFGLLRLTTAAVLWALDARWPTTWSNPNPARASMDAGPPGTITLYPIPLQSGNLMLLSREYPPQVSAPSSANPTSTLIPLPPVWKDYFTYAALAGARGKESDLAQQEMADHYRARIALYDQLFDKLYGPGQ